MKPERAWVRLQSGGRLNLLSPDPFSWTHRGLAIGLARTYCWGGHSCWARPLSVAQHSILVLALRQRHSADRTLTPAEMRRELLHDAARSRRLLPAARVRRSRLRGRLGRLVLGVGYFCVRVGKRMV